MNVQDLLDMSTDCNSHKGQGKRQSLRWGTQLKFLHSFSETGIFGKLEAE